MFSQLGQALKSINHIQFIYITTIPVTECRTEAAKEKTNELFVLLMLCFFGARDDKPVGLFHAHDGRASCLLYE